MAHVSILLQTYNHAPFLAASIDSLLSQSIDDYEILVVDDCSQDNTDTILDSFRIHPKITVIRNESNLGQHATTNLHMKMLVGEYFLFASGDDVYHPQYLENAVNVFNRYPSVGIVHVNGHIIDHEDRNRGSINHYPAYPKEIQDLLSEDYFILGEEFFNLLLHANLIISHSTCVIKRSSLIQAGSFDESLPQVGDWDMWMRIALVGDVAYLAEPLVGWRRHDLAASKHLHQTGQSFEDMTKLSNKLLYQYPEWVRDQLRDDPYILLLGYLGAAIQSFRQQQEKVLERFVAEIRLFLSDYRVDSQALVIKLAVQSWYIGNSDPKDHNEALAFIEYAHRNLPAHIRKQIDSRDVVAHYWALNASKAWRARRFLQTPVSALRAVYSSPSYVVKLISGSF